MYSRFYNFTFLNLLDKWSHMMFEIDLFFISLTRVIRLVAGIGNPFLCFIKWDYKVGGLNEKCSP